MSHLELGTHLWNTQPLDYGSRHVRASQALQHINPDRPIAQTTQRLLSLRQTSVLIRLLPASALRVSFAGLHHYVTRHAVTEAGFAPTAQLIRDTRPNNTACLVSTPGQTQEAVTLIRDLTRKCCALH